MGKSLDGFCPMGPVVVTADEFGEPQNKRLQLRVNGVTKQDGSTSNMIFPVDVIIESLSKGLTLEAGDVIATGTPDGVGMGRTPQEFLQNGDVLETEIETIGTLRNRIVDL
jgi:2-keto-4-pentenoate hydratase/2-oxohepta-3-ene-1,7-dioic acid hydratase in catechol pathway